MKRAFLFLFLSTAVARLPGAPSTVGLLPQDKTPTEVAADERNPFGKRAKASIASAPDSESEELKIRAVIQKLPLGGITRGYGVTKVLLGSFTVAEGELLPDVVPGQTEKIRVLSVTGDRVVLGFVDKDGTSDIRKLELGIDLKPVVRFKLGSKTGVDPNANSALGGVTKENESTSGR